MAGAQVVVLGAGPAGLAAAAALGRRGVTARLLDRSGLPGGAYRTMFEGITLASPSSLDGLPGLPFVSRDEYPKAGELHAYLQSYAEHHALSVERREVLRVERVERGFVVVCADGPIDAELVVVATGMWDFPRRPALSLAAPGRAVLHARDWRGPDAHPEEHILVVGSATSAVEIAESIARTGRTVTLSARSRLQLVPNKLLGLDVHHWIGPLERLPAWLTPGQCDRTPTLPATDAGFSKLRAQGLVRVAPGIERVDDERVHFVDGTSAPFELVITATGYTHATPFLDDSVARATGGHLVARRCESVSWPGLFVIGSPCASGLASPYLRGIGPDAELIARRIVELLKRAAAAR